MNKDKTFIKILWSYILVIIIPVTILGLVTIGLLFNNLANDTETLNINILEQFRSMVDGEMEKILTLSYQAEKNDKIVSFATQSDSDDNMKQYNILNIITELHLYQTNNSICESVGIYVKDREVIITDTSMYSPEEYYESFLRGSGYSCEQWFHEVNNGGIKHFFIQGGETEEEDESVMYCRALAIKGSIKDVVFLACINKSKILSALELTGMQEKIEFAMVDRNGKVILKSENFDTSLMGKESDDIVYRDSAVMDFQYVYQLPRSGLTGNVQYVIILFVALLALTVLISFGLASWHTGKMRRLILAAFDESRGLEADLNKQKKITKEQTLLNLLYNVQVSEPEYNKLETEYNAATEGRKFAVMAFAPSHEIDVSMYSQAADMGLNEINNIISGRLSEMHIKCDCVRTGMETYVYILVYEGGNMISQLGGLPEEFWETYNIAINLGIGEEFESLKRLNISYEGAVSALRCGLHDKPGEAVYYNEIKNLENTKIYYNGEKEMLLIRSIKIGAENDLQEILDEIYRVNFYERHLSYSTLKRLISSISLTVYKVLDELYSSDAEKYEKYGRVCQNLARNDDAEECFKCLKEICLALCADAGKKNGSDMLKEQIVSYIAKNYQNDALSLDMLAEHLGISYHYLSRMFKVYLGTNFTSYITAVRLEKAKQLLKESDATIEEIAERTGFYGSNSLIRAFKKYYDITPGKYRKQDMN